MFDSQLLHEEEFQGINRRNNQLLKKVSILQGFFLLEVCCLHKES